MQYTYPYNLGVLDNLRAVFGQRLLLAAWPQPSPGDGLSYPVGPGVREPDAYTWPPEDPFRQRQKANSTLRRLPEPEHAVFTSGSLLAAAGSVRHRLPQRAAVPPYHDDFDARQPSGEVSEDDDNVPLGKLARGGSLDLRRRVQPLQLSDDEDPQPAVRLRRGSEGYEVRPVQAGWAQTASLADDEDTDGWVGGGFTREGLVDSDGDRIRSGPRYNQYEPEVDSEEWSGSEESWE